MLPSSLLRGCAGAAAACSIACSAFAAPTPATSPVIDLHVCVTDGKPVLVDLLLERDAGLAGLAGLAGGMVGGAIQGAAIDARNQKLADTLAEQLDPAWDSMGPAQAAIEAVFRVRGRSTALTLSNDDFLLPDRSPDIAKMRSSGHRFVLVVEPAPTYKTADTRRGLVAAGVSARLQFVDVYAKRVIWKTRLFAGAGAPLHWKQAIDEAQPLVANYPAAADRFAQVLYTAMLRDDALSAIAARAGVPEVYPPIKNLLKKASRSFFFTRKIPPGWTSLPIGNRLLYVIAPEDKDRDLIIATEIDMLIPELDQDFATVEEYARHRRLSAGSGEPLAVAAFGISAPVLDDTWFCYLLDEPVGLTLAAHRKEGRFVITHSLAAAGESREEALRSALPAFQRYVSDASFKLHRK